ncbi:hypothetical protein AB8880_12770 [Alphaproteobacteria bacterium LSUCC0684]
MPWPPPSGLRGISGFFMRCFFPPRWGWLRCAGS